MRRILIAAVALLAALPSPSAAAERGAIEGVVLNETTGEPQAGAEVVLVALLADEPEPVRERATTDGKGRFRFADLRTGEETLYTVDVTYKAGLYPGEALTLPSDTVEPPVYETTTRVWEPTTDPSSVLIRRNVVFAIPRGNEIAIVESVKIVNLSDANAYVGRGADIDANQRAGTLGLALPPNATESTVAVLESSLSVPELQATSFGMSLTSAIPPGESDITYSYRLSGTGGSYDLTRTALYPILEMQVLAEELRIESNRLTEDGRETIDGTEYRRWTAGEDLDAGDQLQLLAIADAGTSSVLTMGAIVLGIVLVGAIAFIALRRASRRITPAATRDPESHDEIVMEIARLDLEREAGDIGEDEWSERRAELKSRLGSEDVGARR